MKETVNYKHIERQSNIELLRILAIMGVIVLHYNNVTGGNGLSYVQEGNLNFYVLYLLETIFICAVDLFIIISGYFMCRSDKISLWKPIELIAQVLVFSFSRYILISLVKGDEITIIHLLGSLLPKNYFVILYSCVYIISPFINVLFNKLSKRNINQMMTCSILLFSVYPTMVDVLSEFRGSQIMSLSSIGMYGSQWGYTIVNFVLMYTIGAYIRKTDCWLNRLATVKLLFLEGACIFVLMIWAMFNTRTAWEYCNPVVIFESVITLLLFLKIDIGVNRLINNLASGVFTVFLLHGLFIRRIGVERFVNQNVLIMLSHILAAMFGIYLICFLVHLIYKPISAHVFQWLTKKIKLPLIKID